MEKCLSRRNFFAGAGVAAAATAAFAAVGCAPTATQATAEAGDGSTAEAGNHVRWSWEAAPSPIEDDDIADTIECEVLVLGFGSAGAPAALYATTAGANTVVMTKRDTVEANGAWVGSWNSRHDSEFGLTYDPLRWRRFITEQSRGRGNPRVYGNVIDKSGEALDWFTDMMDSSIQSDYRTDRQWGACDTDSHLMIAWPDPDGDGGVQVLYDGFPKMMQAVADKIAEQGGTILYETPAVQLVTDENGGVIGAIGRNAKGEHVKVLASKGVLMATGDITNDDEMLQCFCPIMAGNASRNPFASCTGDGHKMAMWVGAAMDLPPFTTGYNYADANGMYTGGTGISGIPWLRVNLAAQRYCDESFGHDAMYSSEFLKTIDALQPERKFFQICDGNYADAFAAFEDYSDAFAQGLEAGTILQADSLENLAKAMGVDAEALAETVTRYNELCDTGIDLDYGVDGEILSHTSIKEAPFFAIPTGLINTATEGGIITNEFLQAVTPEDKPIPGLWVAGTCLGGRFGYEYPWGEMSASNKMGAMSAGINAIRAILGTWDDPMPVVK